MNRYKKVLVLLLCAVMAFCSAACRKAEEPAEEQVQLNMASGQAKPFGDALVREPGALITAQTDPITVSTLSSDTSPSYNYVRISGLLSEPLQNSVNYIASQLAESIATRTLPPYPGLDVYTEEDLVSASLDVVADVVFACNDIVSVLAEKTFGSTLFSCGEAAAATYDLRADKALGLADLFEEGFDYKSVIDKRVAEAFAAGDFNVLCSEAESEWTVSVSDDYAGVSADTPYYIDKNGINILFDYNTEGVSIEGTGPVSVTAGFDLFGESLMIAGGCDPNLYEDLSSSYTVLIPQNGVETVEYESSDDLGRDNIMVSVHSSYPADAPAAVRTQIDSFLDEYVPDENALIAKARKNRTEWLLWDRSAECTRIGDYYALACELTDNLEHDYWEHIHFQYLFDLNGDLLELDDVFGKGFDYKALLQQKLEDTISSVYSRYTLPEGVDAASLLEDGLSFRPGYDALYFETRPVLLTTVDAAGKELSFITPISVTVNYYELKPGELALTEK
jgi:hypothetical protein